MAEFQDVMRQWKRRFEAEKILTDSETCGLDALWLAMDNPEEIESLVMSWAVEHPEPVYPTWVEWLQTYAWAWMRENCRDWPRDEKTWYRFLHEAHIPADIAEKLGLEPKVGGSA